MSVSEALCLACGQNPLRYLGKMMTLAIMKDCLVCGRKFNILDRKHFCSDPCAADAGDIPQGEPGFGRVFAEVDLAISELSDDHLKLAQAVATTQATDSPEPAE